jgi:Resolvase, N terminal domain
MVNIGYARVSTDGQTLDVQLEQLHQAGCAKIFREKESGAKQNRPQLTALLDYVREGDTVTVCWAGRTWRRSKQRILFGKWEGYWICWNVQNGRQPAGERLKAFQVLKARRIKTCSTSLRPSMQAST